ncbi:MAG: hypothetical protein ACTSRA_00310 [Promethearchaeota archaeon]|nr:MAG: hypothetical protein [Helarchaeota virus Nidhogg Meg22_1012]URC17397.1 MAG: hypothetical protein [Helarchaeota virus Nidhogg Meg22_1214]
MTNVNYILKRDFPITFEATATEDLGMDSTGKTWPEAPDTTVGLLLQFTGDDQVGLCDPSSGTYFAGVSEIPVYSGQKATVRTSGIILVVAGETIVAGQHVKVDESTSQRVAVAGATEATKIIGRAITGGNDGDTIKILLRGY